MTLNISKLNKYMHSFIQDATASLVSKTKTIKHITPVLAALAWLPVKFRIDFKNL